MSNRQGEEVISPNVEEAGEQEEDIQAQIDRKVQEIEVLTLI